MYPKNLKYSRTHEWVKVDKDIATVGITDFAAKQLTDLAYLELPSAGEKVARGSSFGVVETVKAVSDLCSPVSGTVVKVNEKLSKDPAKFEHKCPTKKKANQRTHSIFLFCRSLQGRCSSRRTEDCGKCSKEEQ